MNNTTSRTLAPVIMMALIISLTGCTTEPDRDQDPDRSPVMDDNKTPGTEMMEPTDPMDPMNPMEPMDPVDPTDPMAPIEPVDPDPNDPALAWGPTVEVGSTCTPPPLLKLEDIPDDPSLDDGDEDTVAIFEVDGHKLIGKHVTDPEAAAGGLKLWQELTLRFPENQLRDLVQFEIFTSTDPTAIFNRTGKVTTQRSGLKIGFSVENFERNDPDPCAPLVPRRGTFDWSLVHEMGHLRGWVDGSWTRFMETFEDRSGAGEGFPEDGSPVLDREFVTSYAERADGDEDHAESWTTFVMLPESAIPAMTPMEPAAATKVRWMYDQPGLRALRKAIRITEPDGGDVVVTAAPRLDEEQRWKDYNEALGQNPDDPEGPNGEPADEVSNPEWLQGTWRGMFEDNGDARSIEFIMSADNVIEIVRDSQDVELYRYDYKAMMASGDLGLAYIEYGEDALFGWVVSLEENGYSNDFVMGEDSDSILWTNSAFNLTDLLLERVTD